MSRVQRSFWSLQRAYSESLWLENQLASSCNGRRLRSPFRHAWAFVSDFIGRRLTNAAQRVVRSAITAARPMNSFAFIDQTARFKHLSLQLRFRSLRNSKPSELEAFGTRSLRNSNQSSFRWSVVWHQSRASERRNGVVEVSWLRSRTGRSSRAGRQSDALVHDAQHRKLDAGDDELDCRYAISHDKQSSGGRPTPMVHRLNHREVYTVLRGPKAVVSCGNRGCGVWRRRLGSRVDELNRQHLFQQDEQFSRGRWTSLVRGSIRGRGQWLLQGSACMMPCNHARFFQLFSSPEKCTSTNNQSISNLPLVPA